MERLEKLRPLAPAVIMLVAALAFAQTLASRFVWDDRIIILDRPLYRDPSLLWPALWRPFIFSPDYLRPLVVFSFYRDFRLWGFDPFGFHLTNLFLHVLTSGLVFVLVRRALGTFTPNPPSRAASRERGRPIAGQGIDGFSVAALGGLLFALHPVHVEAVSFISGRFDLAMTLFYLLALWAGAASMTAAAGRHRRSAVVFAALTGLATLLALGSKEMALTLPVVLPLYLFVLDTAAPFSTRERAFKMIPAVGAAASATLVYLGIRQASLGHLSLLGSGQSLQAGDAVQHLLLVGHSLLRCLVLLVWPFGTLAPIQYASLPLPASSVLFWAELAIVLGLVIGGVALARHERRLGGFLACFFASLLPVVNIRPLSLGSGSFVAERFLYLPSFFFILVVLEGGGILVRRFARAASSRAGRGTAAGGSRRSPVGVAVAGGIIISAYALTTLRTVPHWHDDESLWLWGKESAPASPMPYNNLARLAAESGQPALGLDYADKAVARDPQNGSAHNNRGLALVELARPDEAVRAFRRAIEVEPENALYWSNLAGTLRLQKRLEEAETVLRQQALPRDPNLGAAHFVLGLICLDKGRPDQAIAPLRQAIRLQPQDPDIHLELARALALTHQSAEALATMAGPPAPSGPGWLELGEAFAASGDASSALLACRRGEEAGADPVAVAIQRAQTFARQNQFDAAQVELSAALQRAPRNARLHNEQGLLARARKDSDKALEAFSEAAKLAPDWPVPGDNLGVTLAQLGHGDEAAAAYAQVTRSSPNYADVHVHWGELLWRQDKRAAAKARFARYLELAPQDSLAERARAYLAEGPPRP